MNLSEFQDLPDEARVWVHGFEQELSEQQQEIIRRAAPPALHDPQAGTPGLLNVLQRVRLRGPTRKRVPLERLIRSALSPLRYENL
jgi:hypothetical protein